MDPFAILGIPQSYDINVVALEKMHRELSRAVHPDRYAATTASEKRGALERAVEVNEAWRVVRDPLRRAEALLELQGISAEGARPEPEFLMEVVEEREALADARAARDCGAVRVLAQTVQTRSTETERSLSHAFAGGRFEFLVEKLGRLRFYRRFLEEVSAIEDEFVESA
jgi:molecular chaperone HscB